MRQWKRRPADPPTLAHRHRPCYAFSQHSSTQGPHANPQAPSGTQQCCGTHDTSNTRPGAPVSAHGTAQHARPAPLPCPGLPEHSVRRHRGPLVRPGTEAPRITESALRFRRFRLCRIAGCAPRSSNRVAPSAGLAAQAHAVCAMHRSERIPPSARGPPATGAAAAGLLLAPLPPGRGGAGPSRGGLGAGQCGVGQHKVHA